MREIILASASPRRAELLKQIGLEFSIMPSDIEERIDVSLPPEEVVQRLALDKAMSIAEKVEKGPRKGALIIGADTIVVKDGILGKPINDTEAFHMLKSLEGNWHSVITGLAVIDSDNLKGTKLFVETRVKMRPLTEAEIKAYIKTGEPADKAGAYGIQGMGAVLVEKIEGCYFNVVGLPLTRLSQVLSLYDVIVLK